MRLGQAFTARDTMNKLALFKMLFDEKGNAQRINEPFEKRINEAFEQGERDWHAHLVAVFGPDEADYLLSLLGKEVGKDI